MANATLEKVAPSKKEGIQSKEDKILQDLGITLDPYIKYMFELSEQNPERALPVLDGRTSRALSPKKFKPSNNIVFTSQIVWEGSRAILRYYDGCETIFASGQPKEKETIDLLIKQTQRRHFSDGIWGVHGDEKMLLAYMFAASWNAESPYKTKTSDTVWLPRNEFKIAKKESALLDEQEKALRFAKEASEKKMRIHAKYLYIPTVDYDSGNELSVETIRTAYRKEALRDAVGFNASYTDDSMEMKYYIEEALQNGTISSSLNAHKASWKTGSVICDISGIHSPEAIAQKLLEFSKLSEGEEFAVQMKALYN